MTPTTHSQVVPGLAQTPAQAALDVGMVDQLAGHVRGQDLLQHGGLAGILGFEFAAFRLAHLGQPILALDLEELPGALAGLHRLQENGIWASARGKMHCSTRSGSNHCRAW